MKMYINEKWTDSPTMKSVIAPYSGEEIDAVPEAIPGQIEQTLSAAEKGKAEMAKLTADERNQILNRVADLIAENSENLARTICLETGKPLCEARGAVSRAPGLLRLSAFEGTQLRGETLPISAPGKIGLTLRVPCGVVLAITPYNYPLLLVIHKIGPALAAGNAVILKPASHTPLTALKLTKLFLDAGLPKNGLQCITGTGSEICPPLCSDSRVRKISFTGSLEVGQAITKVVGVKKLSLELGANCPVIVMPDADIQSVAEAITVGGYVNAGQVCISTQRVIVHHKVYGDFIDALKPLVEGIKVGDPLREETKLGAMITEQEANRVDDWISKSINGGAKLVTGGSHKGAVCAPSIIVDVKPQMRVWRDELFGPAVAVTSAVDTDEAILLANDSQYGLGAGVFTKDMNTALRFAQEIQCGNIMVNWTSLWRADMMPYGGFKQSGIGKEGPRYAVEEMTELKTVVFHT